MATVMTESELSALVVTFHSDVLLMRALPRLVHSRFGQKAVLRRGTGNTFEWRKFGALPAVTTALTEGVTPEAESASVTAVTATPSWYGAYIRHSDELDMTSIDPLAVNFSEVLGEQCGNSIDQLTRDHLVANASIRYAGGATARADIDSTNDKVGYRDVILAVAALMAGNAAPIEGDKYVAIVHPHTWATLIQDDNFFNAFAQAQPEGEGNPLMTGFLGSAFMCNWYVSSNAKEWADAGAGSTADVYSILFIGQEAYGTVGIANETPQETDLAGTETATMTGQRVRPVRIIAKSLESGGSSDPLNQRASFAWKAAHAAKVLNSAFIVSLEHANDFTDA